ncbi:MAG: glycosyltransferase family 2 protein, partial [Acetobacter sp.]
MSVAIALFVKNEAHDIISWISWHFALGVDKIYVYDDYSTDGTFEILKCASLILNIEVFKTDLSQSFFFYRQRDSYFDAIKRSVGIFDWVALLDGDEYIDIRNFHNINDYLGNFQSDHSAIALNWCIYGSSSRIMKDNIPVYKSFNYHSDQSLNDNSLVKSIVRPEKIVFNYENPHKFFIADGVYVDGCGENFDWKPGATKDILWEGARINHYVCRSMEHFVSRIRRRIGVDLSNSTVYWDHFNRNDIYDPVNVSISAKADEFDCLIKKIIIKEFFNRVLNKYNIIYPNMGRDKSHVYLYKKCKVFNLKSYHKHLLSTNNIDGHVVQKGNEDFKIFVVFLDNYDCAYLYRYNNSLVSNIKYHIFKDNRKQYCYKFNVEKVDDEYLFFKSPENGHYLTSLPEISGFAVEASREDKNDWEKFSLVETNMSINVFASKSEETFETLISEIIESGGYLDENEF